MDAYGFIIGVTGAVLAMLLSSIGSSIAVGRAGILAGGLLSKGEGSFGNMLVLQLLPATQGLYGFIVAFMAMLNMGVIGGGAKTFDFSTGLAIFAACLPIGIIGIVSALYQGRVAMAGMELCVKQDKQIGRAMTMAALVEIFAIFALVVSLLGVLGLTA